MFENMKQVHTIKGLIQALGGTCEVAARLRRSPQAVSNWIGEGEIPPGHHFRLFLWATAEGIEVHPSVWGMDGDELARLARPYRAGDEPAFA